MTKLSLLPLHMSSQPLLYTPNRNSFCTALRVHWYASWEIHQSITPIRAAKIIKSMLQYLKEQRISCRMILCATNILFAFLKVASRIPPHKCMLRTDHNTYTGHSIARCELCLSPNNSIILRLAYIDLVKRFRLQFLKEKEENTHFRLINVIRNKVLIRWLLNERAPSWHQLNIF